METTKDFKNNLLKRRELSLVIDSDKNPGMASVAKTISEKFKSAEDVIVVKNLDSRFGRKSFFVEAFIYDSVADKARIEPKKKEKKKAEGSN